MKNWMRAKQSLGQTGNTGYLKSVLENGSPSKRRPNLPWVSKTQELEPQTPLINNSPIRMATIDFDRSSDSKARKRKKTAIRRMIDLRLDVSEFSMQHSEDATKIITPQKKMSKFLVKRRDRSLEKQGRNTLVQSISGNKIAYMLKSNSYTKTEPKENSSRRKLDSSCFLKGLITPKVKLASPTADSTSTVYRLAAMESSKKKLYKY